MGIKVVKKLNNLKKIEKVKPTFFRLLNKFIKEEVISSLERGVSPVNKGGKDPQNTGGKLRFIKYSDSYTKAIKRGDYANKKQRPVNLKLTGKLHKSIKSKIFKDYLRVWFTDKKAKYHNELGAGKSGTIRRLVPDPKKGEQFNAGIRRRIRNTLGKAVELILK